MRKNIAAFLLVAMAVGLLAPAASAVPVGTLGYSVSTTTVGLSEAGTGSFAISIPAPSRPFSGVQITVQVPDIDIIKPEHLSVACNMPDASVIQPTAYDIDEHKGKYSFSLFAYPEGLSGALVFTVSIEYSGTEASSITIIEATQFFIVGHVTEELVADEATVISLVPYAAVVPSPTPSEPEPTPTPGEPEPTPTPGEPEPTPTPDGPEPTPTPGEPEPTPTPGEQEPEPTPTPGELEPEPTPTPAEQEPEPTPTPAEQEPEPTPTPVELEPTPPASPVGAYDPGQMRTSSASFIEGAASVLDAEPDAIPGGPAEDAGDDMPPSGGVIVPVPRLDLSYGKAFLFGYPDGTARPEADITRAETASLLYSLAMNEDKADYAANALQFNDVAPDEWYCEAVGFFAAAGVIIGYPDGTFGGDQPITRAEFAAILVRLAEGGSDSGAEGEEDGGADGGVGGSADGGLPFGDVEDHWAYAEILAAYGNGWVQGYPDGTFQPESNIARAEAVAMVNRMIGRDTALYVGYPMVFSDVPPDEWYYMDILAASNDKE